MALPPLYSIELCAGVGMLGEGVRAAFELYGIEHRTVCYVEREAAAAGQLATLMEVGALDPAPIWSDLLTFDGAAWCGCVDLVIAGFPCQDISLAGRRAGLDGKRSGLFFNVLDIAEHCGAWGLVLENVGGIATATTTVVDEAEGQLEERAAARVVGELADRGWNAEWLTLSASDVGASHGRLRWFCFAWRRVADTGHGARAHQQIAVAGRSTEADDCAGGQAMDDADGDQLCGQRGRPDAAQRCGAMADANRPNLEGRRRRDGATGRQEPDGHAGLAGGSLFAPGPLDPRWPAIVAHRPDLAPAVEPSVRMLADGLACLVDESRAHQLRQVGNGVVPLQAAAAVVELVRRAGLA